MTTWRNAGWLAVRDLRNTWPSHSITLLATALLGLTAMFLLTTSLTSTERVPGGWFSASLADWIVLLTAPNFAVNWLSSGYMTIWRDPFSKRLAFLRSLPIPVRELVAGRLLFMLLSTMISASVFFIPFYLLLEDLRELAEPSVFLWFTLVWTGYALASGGVALFLELGLPGKVTFWVQGAWAAVLVCVIVVFNGLLGRSLVAESLGLAETYGAAPAALALCAGLAGFLAGARATQQRLERRELEQ